MEPTAAKRTVAALVAAALTVLTPFTAYFEGTRHTAYPDPVYGWEVPTICRGHTKGVTRGMRATQAQCDAWLQADLDEAAHYVLTYTTVPLNKNELAAYTDFVFNVGAGSFRKSTLLRKLNAGDRTGACNELPRWVYAGGQKLRGLVARRTAEQKLCLTPETA
ncbi:lysozyme (plasmid) [Ralstonia syzygii subsp. celebesensis]|uniref:Lysozyme n=1 Tax=blood disease bacterium R229 TaxID=741978 RepID=G2ZW11_9RALS|nr:lysozyme [Ralstonia syzygii]QQV57867.1 lysozyme [Ralstonia syzygii subsp. celebesensis]CCA83295.1 putative lysozyme from prophage [blood disease bacterium R229]